MHKMDRLKSTEGESESSISKLVIQFILFVQSLSVGATGIIGILTYTCTSVDTERLKNLSRLTAITACIQLFIALISFTPKCKYDISTKVLLFVVSLSSWVIWILIYTFVQVYDYEKELTLVVSLILVFDMIYVLLLFCAIFLLLKKICRTENRVEKSTKLLHNEQTDSENI